MSALLYKPWKMGARVRLRERDLVQLGLGAALLAGATLLSVLCLRITGAWRWSLLESSDVLVFGALGLLWSAQSHVKSPGQLRRATLLGAVGVVLLLLYTPSSTGEAASSLAIDHPAALPLGSADFVPTGAALDPPVFSGDALDADAVELQGRPGSDVEAGADAALQDPAGDAYDSTGAGAGVGGGAARKAAADAADAAGAEAGGEGQGQGDELGDWLQPRPPAAGGDADAAAADGAAAAAGEDGGDGEQQERRAGGTGRLLLDAPASAVRRSAARGAAAAAAGAGTRSAGAAAAAPAKQVVAPPAAGPGSGAGAAPAPQPQPQRPTSSRWRARRAAAIAAAKRVRATLDAQTVGSTLLAGAFLVGAAWLNGLRRRLGRALAADTNLGTRRVLALTLAGAACIAVPLALINAAFSSGSADAATDAAAGVASGDVATAGAAGAVAAASASASSPSLLWFLLVASLFGCVHFLLGDIALELPLLSSVFGGSSGGIAGLTGAGAGSAASGSSAAGAPASSGGAQAAAIAAQDTAAVRCVLLLLVLAGSSLTCVLGSPALSSQLTLLGLLGACAFYAPAVVAASGLDTRRAVTTLRKRMASGGSGGSSGGALLPTSTSDVTAGTGAGAGAAGFVTSWFQGLGDLFLVAGHAAGLISDGSGGSGSDATRREDRGGVAANRWDDERSRGGGGFRALTRRVLRHVWSDPNSRKILIFLAINVRACAPAAAVRARARCCVDFKLAAPLAFSPLALPCAY